MGFNYKAIFVDLDGTLLNSHKVISQKNLKCLNEFVDNGVPVVIATGRTLKSVKKVTQGLKLETPVITLNGNDIRKSLDGYSMMLSYVDNKLKEAVISFKKTKSRNYQEMLVRLSKICPFCQHP